MKGQQKNTFIVPPSYNFWAPWIGPKTCSSNHVLNTEYQKVRPPKPTEVSEMTVTEDRLREELYKQKVKTQFIIFSILSSHYFQKHVSPHIFNLLYFIGSGG